MKTRFDARTVARVLVAGGLLVAALGFSGGPGTQQIVMKNLPSQPYAPGELLVKFKPGVSTASQAQSLASVGAIRIVSLNQPGWMHIKLAPTLDVPQALAAYSGDPNVEAAQPNYLYHLAAIPNDANYGAQWALHNTGQIITTASQPGTGSTYTVNNPGTPGDDLDIQPAWDHITDCSMVTVAVVDSGVNYNNVELAANMWSSAAYPLHGWNFINNTNDPMDLHGHGTHVAGIIGAVGNNGAGTTGVCWKASIMAVRVVDAAGVGTSATITQGIDFAVTNGAKIINMSLAGAVSDPLLSNSISTAQAAGVVVVAAAGNDGLNSDLTTPTYPCDFTQANIICVAALDQKYQLASFSNYGLVSVDVGAPGTNVLNTWPGASAQITDPLTTGWTVFSTTAAASGGWASAPVSTNLGLLQMLVDPLTWPQGGLYNNNTDDRVYKAFNLTGASSAAVSVHTNINVANNDYFRLAYNGAGGDPFALGGTIGYAATNHADGTLFYPDALDISACISATCSIGAQLQTDASVQAQGVALTLFSIETLALNTTSQNTLSGTSMATPHATGVAAMVMAYNPADTYSDVVNAVTKGGRPVSALANITVSGNAVDALAALAYIHPPAGLTASVQ